MKLIKKAIKEYYGKRCPDFEPECIVCQAWAEFDVAKQTVKAEERKEILRLLNREIDEMREGWQEGSVAQLKILKGLREKFNGEEK